MRDFEYTFSVSRELSVVNARARIRKGDRLTMRVRLGGGFEREGIRFDSSFAMFPSRMQTALIRGRASNIKTVCALYVSYRTKVRACSCAVRSRHPGIDVER